MLVTSLIVKKRKGCELSDEEIRFIVEGYCQGAVADYQMSSLAMAICLQGMNQRETMTLTRAMLESGDCLPRRGSDSSSASERPRVDKHSTGGLGDKVSLILAPLLAACGVAVPMISGRGLGLTGGTLDKLESISGFRTDLDAVESLAVLEQVGTFIISSSENIAPADRRLYALRDVTGTVESVALITASILSKKLAASLDALVMDVKVGEAAFMKTPDDARELAASIVRVGTGLGLPTTAILSDMDQPLGRAVGNALEVNEAVEVLQNRGPQEVRDLTVALCVDLLVQVALVGNDSEARRLLYQKLEDGSAWEIFAKMVHAQGGRLALPLKTATPHQMTASHAGYVAAIDCQAIGEAVVAMGGGRRRLGDVIDPTVGVEIHVRIGDRVESGELLMTVHCDRLDAFPENQRLATCITLVTESVPARALVMDRLGGDAESQEEYVSADC